MGSLIDSYMNIQISVIKTQAEAQIKELQSEIRSLQTQLSSSGAAGASFFDQTTNSVGRLTTTLRSAGYSLITAFTGPVVAAGRTVLTSYLDNAAAAANLAKVYGSDPTANYRSSLVQLQKAFEALSDEYGVQQSQVTAIAADWAAAGVQGTALAVSTENTLKAMVLGDIDSGTATTALIAIQAQYGLTAQGLTVALNQMNAVENQTGVTLGGLIQAFQKVGGEAALFGVDVPHLAAMIAAITPAAGSATQAGNALKTILDKIVVTTPKASALFTELGINTSSLAWTNENATQRMEQLAIAFGTLTSQQKAQVGVTVAGLYQINRFDQVLQDMDNYLSGNTKALSYYGEALTATADPAKVAQIAAKELSTVLTSQPQLLKELGTSLKNQMMDIITQLIPVILQMADGLLMLAQWFGNLNPYIQKFVGIAILVLAILGPVLLYVAALQSMFHYLGDAVGFILKPLTAFFGIFSGGETALEASSAAISRSVRDIEAATTTMSKEVPAATAAMSAAVTADLEEMSATGLTAVDLMADNIVAALNTATLDLQAVWDGSLAAMNVATGAGTASLQDLWDASLATMLLTTQTGMAGITTAVETGMLAIAGGIMAGATDLQAIWDTAMEAQVAATAEAQSAVSTVLEAAMLADIENVMVGSRNLVLIWGTAMAEMQAETEALAAGTLLEFGELGIGAEAGLLGGLAAIPEKAAGMLAKVPGAIEGALAEIIPAVEEVGSGIFAALTGPWGIALALIITGVIVFKGQIVQAWNGIVSWFQGGASGLESAFSPIVGLFQDGGNEIVRAFNALPDGVHNALQAVINTVAAAAKIVYGWFSYLDPFAHHSPSLVENVTQGMAIVAAQIGTVTQVSGPIMQAYDDIQTFNDSITALANTARNLDIAKGLKDLTSAGASPQAIASYNQLQSDLTTLTQRQSDLTNVINQQKVVVDADNDALTAANAALTAQQGILDTLTKDQTNWNNLITTAKANITAFSQDGIIGQQAMSDQIFNNTQAQKSLQLQMMQMQDVTGPIDQVSTKLAALAGQIETLSGEQKSLRQGGAGSEITGGIQSQIDDLTQQQVATQASSAAYQNLSDQLTALQNQGQELDLENSLDFDGLTRQINEAANAITELPFDVIMQGISENQSALAGYTQSYNTATDAVTAQQTVVDNLTVSRDALQATYDTENAKLTTLQNSYQNVSDAITAVNNSLQTMSDNASKATSAAAGAAGGFSAGSEGNFASANQGNSLNSSPSTAGLDDFTSQALKNANDAFSKLDFLTPIKAKWKQATDWVKTNMGPGFSQFAGAVEDETGKISTYIGSINWSKIGSSIANNPAVKTLENMAGTAAKLAGAFYQLISPDVIKFFDGLQGAAEQVWQELSPKILPLLLALQNLFVALWPVIKPIVEILAVELLGALKIIASIFVSVVFPVLKFFVDQLGTTISVITDVVNIIADLLQGKWAAAWNAAKKLVSDVWNGIVQAVEDAWGILSGLVMGIVNGIVGFFEWLVDELIGHSIIPDLINGIVTWFTNLPGMLLSALATMGTDLLNLFIAVGTTIWNWLTPWGTDFINFFVALPGRIVTSLVNMGTTVAGIFVSAFTYVKTQVSNLINDIVTVVAALPGDIIAGGGALLNAGATWIGNLWSGLSGAAATVGSDIVGVIKRGLNTALGLPWKIPAIDTHVPGVPTFGGQTILPAFQATGGIFNKATNVIVGESGAEAIIPLTNSKRAWALVQQSGLLNIIAPMLTQIKSAGTPNLTKATTRAFNTESNSPQATNISYSHQESHTITFTGDLSFPNIKSSTDASELLKNLEVLAKGA